MEASGLSKVRWSSDRSNTLGRRFDASRPACNSARPDAEDSSVRGENEGESPRVGSKVMRFEGGQETLEPRTRNQSGRGSSVFQALELSTSYSSEFEAVEHQGRKDAVGAAQRKRRRVTAFPFERVSLARTPGAAADLACPQGRRESKPSRGRETPRTDGVGRGSVRRARSLRRRR